ncbi:hypothetical protein AtubIFM55763_002761 [Aspergillus tubingensis]|uniref:Trafficking PGA2 n=3 Tax=Aspergillus subgen. Circumdati TaxID=2720871 RepID=A0A1L9NQ14_ASPTC|nr:hypothetical protein BO79DRAFT_209695 [Aspergillus costaricaensis CBS 115574]OJI91194.1 hypothetical protein ASPTUDRAFT_52896 [Aspergillus tubingensis CBS 134.48]GLA65896.1 hypothetical protein AtubIFM54640_008096 [Aspergillus tubingensis]RAK87632.1 hypothetical protein BO79DRAFT_209695 [Aspergillus costaricaensis CBS 115574]GLA72232.1 hypothetical protein AtubIFM55763_002761 [Aspergillus tubingensis]GLA79610.1 hypothetical protein AtubIFM56815_000411 [Aspergillus tubingensis]
MATRDPGEVAADALNDFFGQLYSFFETIFTRFFGNLYASFADVSINRWTKVILSVIGYLLIRPYIERFFKFMHDRDRKKQLEKEKAKKDGKKAKMSANELRGGAGAGRVLGEVENTDDEIEDGEDFATASGVPEWGKNARKRQKKYMKNLEKEAESRTHNLSEEQLMELLDWSESEDDKAAGKKE